ncbi:family 20 glycosylhydrolase [Solilutibacter silvestris]|nr:family 20 glycosylhydrolase [Lysobacter silvestris]
MGQTPLSLEAQATPVIPRPANVRVDAGTFRLTPTTRWSATDGDAAVLRIARDFSARIKRSRGFAPLQARDTKEAAIRFAIDRKATLANDEGYLLDVTPRGVTITARAPAGLFHGAVTLWQLATANDGKGATTIAAQHIDDAPRFAWRGLMLDVARHFRSVDEVKALIDQMALHKFNTFHWHLTDDQGWRIEIKRYPELTRIGGCRIPAGAAGRDADGKPHPYCGHYTQAQIRDVVKYASDRYITVIPEIDLPGHAQAAIAAYPQLGVIGTRPPVSPDWGVNPSLYNVDDGTFKFLEDVLDEVMALFPSRDIHLGGDEALKDQWIASPAVQAKKHELGVKNEMQLQSWFMGRLATYLQQHGRRMLGWDEILEGGIPGDAVVMSWRGTQGAIDAARAGHDVVLSPAPDLYFDHVQSDRADETPGRLAVMDLKHVYDFETMPTVLDAGQQAHVLGAQANIWTEHQRTNQRVQRTAFPRAAALAEATWTPVARRDWADFLQRMAVMQARYRGAGFDASDSAFAANFKVEPQGDGRARVAIDTQSGFGTLRYTMDGSAPTPQSPAYDQPLDLAVAGQTIVATAFAGTRALAAPRRFVLDAHGLRARRSTALRQCKGGLTLRLEDDAPRDGERAVVDVDLFDACWIYPQADLDGMATLSARIGQLPFNFQLAHDSDKVVTRPATMPGGALEVRLDSCSGPLVATLPLAPARVSPALTTLVAPLPKTQGRHDLCFTFASGTHDPLWMIDEVALLPRP